MGEFLEDIRAKQSLRQAVADAFPDREEILAKQPPSRAPPRLTPTVADLRTEFWNAPLEALLDRPTTAAGLGRSVAWMELKATRGGGPPFIKFGRRVLYEKRTALEWLRAHSRQVSSTSAYSKEDA